MDLIISNLSFRYGSRKPMVLDDISLSFPEGGVCGMLGPNGAGKSTLLYLISGLLTPTKGSVTFDNIPTALRRPSVLAKIYLVPEEPVLPRMSLDDYVDLYSVFYPQFNNDILLDALKEFDMFRPERLDSLSMGQKKKIVLSFALATSTPVLLMDEPTNGLDIPGKAAFRRLIARYASDDKLFLISTHQVRDLDQLLDRILIMDLNKFIINESVYDLQKYFSFKRNLQMVPENAISSLPSIGGFDVILPNDDQDESDINLELLFEAAIKQPEIINSVINLRK
ncbi:MAG: ABC transporter ATP-binding protein [Muribaculaceae bacterium]|nr:ABC transporter ATP-binding protein [Muribaculaceae bacterium]